MADAHGSHGEYDYSLYAFRYGWDYDKLVFPTGHKTIKDNPVKTEFVIDDKIFSAFKLSKKSLLKKICEELKVSPSTLSNNEKYNLLRTEDFIENDEFYHEENVLNLFPVKVEENAYYWPDDTITLIYGDNLYFSSVLKIYSYNSYEEFLKHIEQKKEYNPYVRFNYSEENIK